MSIPPPQSNAITQYAGRNYPRYAIQHNIHLCPVDEEEEQRFDEINEILQKLLGGGIDGVVLPPALHKKDRLKDADILDCGYGKAAWVDKLLGFRPEAVVVGIDVFTGQGNSDDDDDDDEDENGDGDEDGIESFIKKRWNLNIPFRQDTSSDRLRPETFDLINSRMLADGINANRWETYVRELWALLKLNGWLQMVEFHAIFQSDSGRDAPFLSRWWDWYSQKMLAIGKNPRVGSQLRSLMTNAGFVDVQYYVSRLPIGNWDPDRAQLGIQTRDVLTQMIRDVSLYPFLAVGQMPKEQYEDLLEGARRELHQPGLKLYLNVHVAYGRKPSRRR